MQSLKATLLCSFYITSLKWLAPPLLHITNILNFTSVICRTIFRFWIFYGLQGIWFISEHFLYSVFLVIKIRTFRPWVRGSHRLMLIIYWLETDLPLDTINSNLSDNPKTIPFVDDASEIVNIPNFTDFKKVINMIFKNMSGFLLICLL